MVIKSFKFVIFLFGALSYSLIHANPIKNDDNPIKQLRTLVEQIKKNYSQKNQSTVYVGNEQFDMLLLDEELSNSTDRLSNLLSSFEKNVKKQQVTYLQWLPNTGKQLSEAKRINAGVAGSIINICRASFLGAYQQSKALYPGQLVKEGCRISYGGYAFIVTKYDVLTGDDKPLKWISIAEVKQHINPQNGCPPEKIEARGMQAGRPINPNGLSSNTPSIQAAINTIKINNACPISGGYEGGNPVLICRTHTQSIGKLVFFDTGFACDIGVDEKEVVITDNYDLLFGNL
jgi:hypothetical protein